MKPQEWDWPEAPVTADHFMRGKMWALEGLVGPCRALVDEQASSADASDAKREIRTILKELDERE